MQKVDNKRMEYISRDQETKESWRRYTIIRYNIHQDKIATRNKRTSYNDKNGNPSQIHHTYKIYPSNNKVQKYMKQKLELKEEGKKKKRFNNNS